jgi:hypothetical protein
MAKAKRQAREVVVGVEEVAATPFKVFAFRSKLPPTGTLRVFPGGGKDVAQFCARTVL